MITYFHLIFHVLFHIIQGLSVTWNHVPQIYFLLSSHKATISAEGKGEGGTLRVTFKVFKPEPGKRKSFYFAIQFKGVSFLNCSISTSSCHQEHIETRRLLTETYIFYSNQSLKKMPEPQDIDHALQTSLPFQGFWPKNMTWSWDQMAKSYLSLETCKTPTNHTTDLKEVYCCLICLLSALLSLYHLFCFKN